ncbi:MAG: hypothetical protein ACO1O6_13900 [Bacteroidota bacterium]
MRKLTMIALFICGLTASFNAQTTAQPVTTSLSVDASSSVQSNTISASDATFDSSVSDAAAASSRGKKKFSDRSLVGKILIVAGVAIFVVICALFGTVSIG